MLHECPCRALPPPCRRGRSPLPQGTPLLLRGPGSTAQVLEADLRVCGGSAVVHILNDTIVRALLCLLVHARMHAWECSCRMRAARGRAGHQSRSRACAAPLARCVAPTCAPRLPVAAMDRRHGWRRRCHRICRSRARQCRCGAHACAAAAAACSLAVLQSLPHTHHCICSPQLPLRPRPPPRLAPRPLPPLRPRVLEWPARGLVAASRLPSSSAPIRRLLSRRSR